MPPKKAFQRQYGRKHGLEPSLTRLVREASGGGQPVSFRTVCHPLRDAPFETARGGKW